MAGIGLLFWVAVIHAVFDWRDRRAGRTPRITRAEYIGVAIAVALIVVLIGGLAALGGNPEGLGQAAMGLVMVVVILWEFHRFRVARRLHRLSR